MTLPRQGYVIALSPGLLSSSLVVILSRSVGRMHSVHKRFGPVIYKGDTC